MKNKDEPLKELAQDLDSKFGDLLLNMESIKAIRTELGTVRVAVEKTDTSDWTAMALRFRDMRHKMIILHDLLRYTTNDLLVNLEKGCELKDKLFHQLVKGGIENE